MSNIITETFGSAVFNDGVMRERLPVDAYNAVKKTIETGRPLDLGVANKVAAA